MNHCRGFILFGISLLALAACSSSETAELPTPFVETTVLPTAVPTPTFIKGIDISSLPQVEACGGVFLENGDTDDLTTH